MTLVMVGVLGGLAIGRPEPVLLVAPLAAVIGAGLAVFEPPAIGVRRVLATDRATERDEVQLLIEVSATRTLSSLEVFLALPAGVSAPLPARLRGLALGPGATRRLTTSIRCDRWGTYQLGEVWVRARGACGLLEAEGRVEAEDAIRVYPRPETLRRLIRARHTQSAPGSQLARVKGTGVEFADLREFVPGDRVREVNWRATARRGALLVNERHPDRSTDVVLFLDTFDNRTLAAGVRAANSLATAYLAIRDRVGLVSFGGTINWLRPGMGTRQHYLVVDTLLATTAFHNVAWKDLELIPPRMLPPRALVVALSPLEDERALTALSDLRSRGIDLVIVELSPVPFAPLPRDREARLARRLWVMQREVLRNRYRALGVPVAEWTPTRTVTDIVEEVRAWPRGHRPVA